MEENNSNYQEEKEVFISDVSENEGAEKTLYVFSNIIKFIGLILGGICIIAGLGAVGSGEANFWAFLAAVVVGTLIWFLFLVYASLIRVFSNISMSLKDITKILRENN